MKVNFAKCVFGWAVLMGVFGSSSGEAVVSEPRGKAFAEGPALPGLQLQPFYVGYYGRMAGLGVFVAPEDRFEDYGKVYRAMVQVLSRKYSCFMTRKLRKGSLMSFKCRDKRVVVFRYRRNENYVLLHSRQYDEKGYEVEVRNRRIVRVSSHTTHQRRLPRSR